LKTGTAALADFTPVARPIPTGKGEIMDLRGVSPAWALCMAQTMTTALAATVTWLLLGRSASLAALYGGIVAIAPTLYFAVRVGTRHKTSQAKEILGAFYQAELVKLLLTAFLFLIGALLFGKHFAPLMLTCVACLAMNWLMLAVVKFE
jgi:ATP synthase protein I